MIKYVQLIDLLGTLFTDSSIVSKVMHKQTSVHTKKERIEKICYSTEREYVTATTSPTVK
jgi:hypothetical protein